jgi:hypothetical protein
MVFRLRSRRLPERANQAALDLIMQAHTILDGDDDTVVSVSEHNCGEPACGVQTVVLVMRPNQPTKAVKIKKPLDAVTGADLSAALAPLLAQGGQAEVAFKMSG